MRTAQWVMIFAIITAPAAIADPFALEASATFDGMGAYSCSSGTGSSSCTLNGTVPGLPPLGGTVSFGGTSTLAATFGELQWDLSMSSGGSGFTPPQWRYRVDTGFTDTLTVNGYSGSGFIQYGVMAELLPSLGALLRAEGYGDLFLSINSCSLRCWNDGNSSFDAFGQLTSQLFPFTGGVPFSLSLQDELFGASAWGGGDGLFADLSYVVTVDQISLFDANMHPITGYTLSSASGTIYPLPEPGSLLLLSTGVLGVARRMYKSRRNAHRETSRNGIRPCHSDGC